MTLKEFFKIDCEMRVKELKSMIKFFWSIILHVRHARRKHPLFAKRVLWREDALFNAHEAKWQKERIKDNYSLEAVLLSEVHEFLVEMHKGNWIRAFEEACDIVAVLWRALAGDMNNA